ncbi:MAG TPA: efflux RND transporter periplasmic adaptor subunit [Betaproteobacteria bacterium]|nr:efflux RND transporter periplasmic adaptor subunit [Betaproteobacteria bacterium]
MTPLSRKRLAILVLLAAAIAAGGYSWRRHTAADAAPRYQTETVSRGDITQTVAANGTLNPVVLVNVGTQVSGTVSKLYADFNDRVKPGQVLARLDPALFLAQLRQSQASLASARANFILARTKARRSRQLFSKGFVSANDMDQAKETLAAARAQVALSQAQVGRDRTNLDYSIIRSPISGVVVARNIDIGQTVAASFQTPTLFQIAKDLRVMQIDTSVAEADIGQIRVGQPVRFTVDAYPNARFHGKVRQIRLNPTIQQNVVTYNVVVAVDNAKGRLMPGMTAHVRIIIKHKPHALRVPNAALRFKPAPGDHVQPAKNMGADIVYRLRDRRLIPVPLKTGARSSRYTEMLSGNLKEGDRLVTRERGGGGRTGGKFRIRLF